MTEFPYQKSFLTWCKDVAGLKESSIDMINNVITSFWKYYSFKKHNTPNPNNVLKQDVDEYLAQLESKDHLQLGTINKYISYIKKYFRYLADHGYTKNYNLYNLKGRKLKRSEYIYINWMENIPNYLKQGAQPETIKLLTLIASGYNLKELLSVRWLSLKDKIDNTLLKDYIVKNIDFKKMDNPYIFQTQSGQKLKRIESVMRKVRLDQKLFPFPLVLVKLRQSYLLSLVADKNETNASLMDKLGVNFNTLLYYQTCLKLNNIIDCSDQ